MIMNELSICERSDILSLKVCSNQKNIFEFKNYLIYNRRVIDILEYAHTLGGYKVKVCQKEDGWKCEYYNSRGEKVYTFCLPIFI